MGGMQVECRPGRRGDYHGAADAAAPAGQCGGRWRRHRPPVDAIAGLQPRQLGQPAGCQRQAHR